jgi:polyhydroxyalkanoate synthesis regulator phasin
MSTLQQRLAEILSDRPPVYVVDDSEANAIDSIVDMLQKAESDLHAAQVRVEKLKWQLAKAQEYQA